MHYLESHNQVSLEKARRLHTFLALVILSLLSIPFTSFAIQPIRTLEAQVIKVSDGDTIQVEDDLGTKLKIRLYGIDAPELEHINHKTGEISKPGQPYGEESKEALQGKIGGQIVKVEVLDIDKYRRFVSMIWLGTQNINKEMVADGWAWAYRKYLREPYASEFIELEDIAKEKRLGLWIGSNPQAPWEFRKNMRDM